MANFNKVILAGNLTRDPELRYTPKGLAICKFGIAINRNWTTETGEKKEEVTFVDIDAFGRQAETIAQYLKKGGGVMIEGRLKLDQWDDKQTGQKRSKLGVIVEGFQFTGSPNRAEGGGEPPAPRPRPAASAPSAAAPPSAEGPGEAEDDVPF